LRMLPLRVFRAATLSSMPLWLVCWPLGGVLFKVRLTKTQDTTNLAAEATWEVLQGFLGGLHKLDPKIKSKSFNLWTESYGG
jgi:hypothetical protein